MKKIINISLLSILVLSVYLIRLSYVETKNNSALIKKQIELSKIEHDSLLNCYSENLKERDSLLNDYTKRVDVIINEIKKNRKN